MKILFADDDPISRLIVQTAVRSAGHDCDTVDDGAAAWKAFQADRYDVVISDWSMPELTGPELCRKVRAHPRGHATYFIMVTRRAKTDQVFEGMSAGADDYLVKPFDPDDLLTRLIAATRVTSLHVQLNDQRHELEGLNLELTAMTRHDPLTGLGNRRALQQDLELLEARVARYGHRYCMALLDVDHFKSYNDSYGHPAGDQVLEAVAGQLHDHARAGDAIYRYGGEEFLCIFPEQNLASGSAAVERMRASLERLAIAHAGSPLGVLTISAGVAMLDSTNARSASAVLAEADEALYRAKQLGRNRVEASNAVPVSALHAEDVTVADAELEGTTPIYLLIGADGAVQHVSDRTTGLLSLQHDALLGDNVLDRIEPADLDLVSSVWGRVRAAAGAAERFTVRLLDGAGRWRELDLEMSNHLDNPAIKAMTITGFDITKGSLSQIARRLEGRLLKRLPTAVVVIDDAGNIVYWNDRAEATYGYRPAEAMGRSAASLEIGPTDDIVSAIRETAMATGRWEGDYDARHRDGTIIPIHATIERLIDDEIGFHGFVSSSTDISERRQLEEDHAYALLHDPLTLLPNRRLFTDHLDRALKRTTRLSRRTAVLSIGIDDFGTVNERFGGPTGDAVLRAIGELVPAVLATGDLVARMSGDEFIICCEGLVDPVDAWAIADRVVHVLGGPFRGQHTEFELTASVGIAMSSPDSHADGLIRNASNAMQSAKAAGKARIHVFDDAMHHELRARRACAIELERALDSNEIRAWFQPEMSLATGEIVGFEALARWERHDGVVMPHDFISLAEECGLIGRLGRSILVEACAALATWLDAAPERPVRVAVNVSAHQLADPGFPAMVGEIITAAQVPAGRVCLELTESALAERGSAVEALRQLKVIGVELAIDDFGTGYSSLGRLASFPVDYLKIDRSFVAGMAVRREDSEIVAAIIGLARTLGLRTVAEGIEQDFQVEQLANLGCDIGQGFLWSKAVPAAEALALISAPSPLRHHDVSAVVPMPDGLGSLAPKSEPDDIAVVSVAILAHELAAPITVLSGYAELLATTDDPELRVEAIAAVDRATKQVRAALALACDVAALASGNLVLNRSVVNLAAIVAGALELAGATDAPNVSLEIVDVLIEADTDRLVAVLANLIDNATKHAPPGTNVRLVASVAARNVTLHVIDDGPGIPKDQIGLIFRRFGRANRETKGSGLGLYLARAVVRAHGGDLTYQPVPGGGADFAIEIPFAIDGSHWHTAKLYATDDEIVESVVSTIAPAVEGGAKVVVIATPEHRRAIRAALSSSGLRLDPATYHDLDAETTLDALLRHGAPDRERFHASVGALVHDLAGSGRVVAYGEMVSLLCERGDVAGAMRLEEIWRELATEVDFTLLCGYGVDAALDANDIESVGQHHHAVIGPIPVSGAR